MRLKYAGALAATVTAVLALSACKSVNDDRIPVTPVNIVFTSPAMWDLYGVNGALQYRYFIPSERRPSGFNYTAGSHAGFGGILLVCSVLGEPQAYDLACPVEVSAKVRVAINDDNLAECPKCRSTYDVFSLAGHPVSGPAANDGYGLRPYHVHRSTTGESVISF